MSSLQTIDVTGLHRWMDLGYVGTDVMPTTLSRIEQRERQLEEMRVRVLEERIMLDGRREPGLMPPPLPWDRDVEDELFPTAEPQGAFHWIQALAS